MLVCASSPHDKTLECRQGFLVSQGPRGMPDRGPFHIPGPFGYVIPQFKPQDKDSIRLQLLQHDLKGFPRRHPLLKRGTATGLIAHQCLHKIVERDFLEYFRYFRAFNPPALPAKHIRNHCEEPEPTLALRTVLYDFPGRVLVTVLPSVVRFPKHQKTNAESALVVAVTHPW